MSTPIRPRGLLGHYSHTREPRGGGILPSLHPHYHPDTAKALHDLAESNPTPPQYREAKERILELASRRENHR